MKLKHGEAPQRDVFSVKLSFLSRIVYKLSLAYLAFLKN